MDDPHPADADYSAANEPNLDALEDMLDAAIATAHIISGQMSGRRFFRPSQTNPEMSGAEYVERVGRGEVLSPSSIETGWFDTSFEPPIIRYPGKLRDFTVAVDDGFDPPAVEVVPNYSRAIFDEAKEAAMAERIRASATDLALVTGLIEVTESRIRALREDTEIGKHPIVAHALTSMELGLLGLTKVRDDVVNDTESAAGNP